MDTRYPPSENLSSRVWEGTSGAVVATVFASADADYDNGRATLQHSASTRKASGSCGSPPSTDWKAEEAKARQAQHLWRSGCSPVCHRSSRRVKKPGAPGVTEGEGKERGTEPIDAPIVQAQGYTLITARQELGNRVLPGRGPTGPRLEHVSGVPTGVARDSRGGEGEGAVAQCAMA
jgi:hypothetical protein